jgi:branched-chain amino acid transport system substrate-binding protein
MRNRLFGLNTIEVAVPVIVALILGVAALAFLAPNATGGTPASDQTTIRIYSSVPMGSFTSIVHGAQMAFEEVNYQVGNYRIDYVPLNDAPTLKPDDNWKADIELANARRAAEDPDAMAYIGTYNSGAAKISIPVLNRVHMAMISPGNTYPGLTKPGTGNAGEPWAYYPLGLRNYFRVVPADDLQGSAAAAYAKHLGSQRVYVLDDTELYGHGIAVIFARSAREQGLEVVGGPEGIDVHATTYSALASKITQAGADLVYFGGTTANHPGLVLRDLRNVNYQGIFMGADGITGSKFIEDATEGANRTDSPAYATLVGLPAAKLTGAGADWYRQYKSRFSSDENEDFAPFGYEAAKVVISAIKRAGSKDREAIRAAVAATNSSLLDGSHILGDWQFDSNGDTSLVTISVQKMGATWDYQGVMLYDPQAKTWQFQGQ